MRHHLANYRGTLSALALILTLWLAAVCLNPAGFELGPRRVLLSDNEFVGWNSPAERCCRNLPAVHDLLWGLSPFL